MKADKLVKVYIKVRDKRKELLSEFEKKDEELKEVMDDIKDELLQTCKETGAEMLRTEFGTATRSVKKRYWVSDWDAFKTFMLEESNLDLVEKLVAQGNMKTFLEDNPDKVPPSLNVESEYTISVRRKS